jgi:hypothetical protein
MGVVYKASQRRLNRVVAIKMLLPGALASARDLHRFRPVGAFDASTNFYVYVGHYKAGTDSASVARRNVEGQQVRANADALGPAAHVLYTGDFNAGGSTEPAQQTLLAPGGPGQAIDPINWTGTWYNTSPMRRFDSEAPAVNAPTA